MSAPACGGLTAALAAVMPPMAATGMRPLRARRRPINCASGARTARWPWSRRRSTLPMRDVVGAGLGRAPRGEVAGSS